MRPPRTKSSAIPQSAPRKRPTKSASKARAAKTIATGKSKAKTSPHKPSKASAVRAATKPLSQNDTLQTAFAAAYTAASNQVVKNWDLFLKDPGVDTVHQFRVGIRRTRVVLRMFKNESTETATEALDARLSGLNRVIGRVRDLDVLCTEILPQHLASPVATGIEHLIARAAVERNEAAAECQTALSSREWSDFKTTLASIATIEAAVLDPSRAEKTVTKFAARRLRRSLARIRKRTRDFEKLDMEGLHRIRKAAKALRYKFDYLSALYPRKDAVDFMAHLKKMQDAFGDLNDLSLTEALQPIAEHNLDDVELQRAVAYLNGWLAARSNTTRATAQEAWHALKRTSLAESDFRPG